MAKAPGVMPMRRTLNGWIGLLSLSLPLRAVAVPTGEPCRPLEPAAARREAAALVHSLRQELAPVEERIRKAPFLQQLRRGRLPCDRIAALAAEDYAIAASDRLSFRRMAERWEPSAAGRASAPAFFAAAMGLDTKALERYEPRPASQIYPARVAALALGGDRASAAAALALNFPVFSEAMAIVRQGLLTHYGFRPEPIAFITAFAEPLPPSFEAAAIEQIAGGLQDGACPYRIRRAARLLQQAELAFWLAASEPPGSPLPSCPFHPLRP